MLFLLVAYHGETASVQPCQEGATWKKDCADCTCVVGLASCSLDSCTNLTEGSLIYSAVYFIHGAGMPTFVYL